MACVALDVGSNNLADGAFCGFLWVGSTHDLAVAEDGVFALKDLNNTWTFGHESNQVAEERTLCVDAVELFGLRVGHADHLLSDDGETAFFEKANNGADFVCFDSVGLNDGEGTFDCHGALRRCFGRRGQGPSASFAAGSMAAGDTAVTANAGRKVAREARRWSLFAYAAEMRRRTWFHVLVLSALLWGICATSASQAQAQIRSEHLIEAQVRPDGDVDVVETITLLGPWDDTHITRSFWLRGAEDAWPLRQEVREASASTRRGSNLELRKRDYEDRSNLDLLELPSDGVVTLRYRVHRGLEFSDDRAIWHWMATGYAWPGTVTRVRVRLRAPHEVASASLSYAVGYGDAAPTSASPVIESGVATWELVLEAPPDEPISLAIGLPRGTLSAPDRQAFVADMVELLRLPLAAFALILALSIVLVFVRPRGVIAATVVANFIPGAVAVISAFWVTRYWYFEQSHRGVGDDFSGEFIINFGLAGFVVLFAWKQRAILREGNRAAYFAQLAFPAILLVAWPLAFVDRAMLFFPLLAVPVYLYWLRKSVALEFGVGAHRIAEEVGGRGEVAVAELATALEMTDGSLRKALRLNPHLPVVLDHKENLLMSAEAAAVRDEMRVCTYCGGATEVAGMAVRACGYCSREFKSSKKRRTQKPVPVVIEAIAMFFETLAGGAYVFAGTVAFAILAMEAIGGSLVDGLVGSVIAGGLFCIPALLLGTLGAGLRRGHNVGIVKALLVALGWVLLPLLVPLRKLSSRRVQIFTGEFDVAKLGEFLIEKGELGLAEFADYLQSNQEDAAELAQYLAVNQIIDAVYDRRGSRLVSRQLYRDIAKVGSCQRCGGFFGVQQGQATCHFCGSPAPAS